MMGIEAGGHGIIPEQLAARFPFVDIDRVGITGHSGGGFMSAAAMLLYPDFFSFQWGRKMMREYRETFAALAK